MKIQPVSSPHAIPVSGTPESVRTAKAVAAFNAGKSTYDKAAEQQASIPAVDPNSISAEELGAVRAAPQQETQELETSDTVSETAATTDQPEAKPAKDPALERQFQQLARQERQLRAKAQQQDQALKAREAQLQAREAVLSEKPQFDPKDYIPRSRLVQDALGVLEAEGITTYDQITQRAMNRQPVDPVLQNTIDSLKAQIEELKASNETTQKSYSQQQQDAYKAALQQIESDTRKLVKANPQEYEAIAKTKSEKDVVELIERHYKKYGEVLSAEEAAQEVENYLVEEGVTLSTNIDKIKRRIQANVQSSESSQKTQAQTQTQGKMKTLTNATASTRKLSAKERAILAFKGELKS